MLHCQCYCYTVNVIVTLSMLMLHCQCYCYTVNVNVTLSRLMLHCQYFLLSDGGKTFTKAGLKDRLEMSLGEWRNHRLWWLKTEQNRIIKNGLSPKNKTNTSSSVFHSHKVLIKWCPCPQGHYFISTLWLRSTDEYVTIIFLAKVHL